jgi:hypothetical protein
MDGKKLIGGVILFFGLLWVLGQIASRSSSNASAKAPAVAQTEPGIIQDKWKVKEDHSPMDDSKTIVLALDSENAIHGPLDDQKPALMIRCKEGKTDTYVMTGMAASVEEDPDGGPSEEHAVRLRFDSNSPITDHWVESTNHSGLFAGDAISFARQLTSANTFTFEFSPFDSSPATARFDLRGLSEHLPKIADACRWNVK